MTDESGADVVRELPAGGVLIASPYNLWREQVIQELGGREHTVSVVRGGAEALQKLESGEWNTLFLETELPDLNPGEVAELASRRHPGLEVRFLSSSGAAEKQPTILCGTNDDSDRFMKREGGGNWQGSCHRKLAMPEPLPGMVGTSDPILRIYELGRKVAKRTTTVLITGATGTGKEVVARGIHELSTRRGRPFIVVNCAAIPETLFESELFGYVRGAFTGAVQAQAGRISAANGGTLFLDEVGELPLSMQAKLLRFIELKEVQRLGSAEISRVDVRIIAATNVDLATRVAARQFRDDLFFRLSVFCVALPRLEERNGDIVPLARHFLAGLNRQNPGMQPVLSPRAISILRRHRWPGNVRELQLVMERACILAEGEPEILPEHISFPGLEPRCEDERELRGIAI